MSNYRRVLIPIDLMPGRQMTAPTVRQIVDTSDVEITLLHVVDSQPWTGRSGHTLRLMTELEILANRRFRGAHTARRIEWGRPADCILNVLRTDRYDLVLMTAGGDTQMRDPLGSVAAEVLAEAPCPVLLEWPINPPLNQARAHPVCCAIEWDGNETNLVREATSVAAQCASPLILIAPVTVTVSTGPALWDPASRDGEVAGVRRRVEELRDRVAPGASVHVEAGHPTSVLSRALRLHGAGLLVAGGSRETLVASEGQCPVLYRGRARRAVESREFVGGRTA
ncbi:MAG: UspA domain protein [Candidatus Solibacter sp.]|jgi:nucleotide-binding universal stress UspA family protein|nr:UspA domain protein [Candidatus Solibacter sp.]